MSGNRRPVAFVTGASRGIGKAAAIDRAGAGYDVAVSARTMNEGQGRSDTDPDVAPPGGLVERRGLLPGWPPPAKADA